MSFIEEKSISYRPPQSFIDDSFLKFLVYILCETRTLKSVKLIYILKLTLSITRIIKLYV